MRIWLEIGGNGRPRIYAEKSGLRTGNSKDGNTEVSPLRFAPVEMT